MGLGRRACKPTPVVLPIDSSIRNADGYAAYVDSLYTDESTLDLDPADPPARFTLRQWTDEQRDAIEAQTDDRAKAKLGVRCALIGVSGYVVHRDGAPIPLGSPDLKAEGRLGEIVPLSWMRDANLPHHQIEWLYLAARSLSEAALPLSRRAALASGPPASESTGSGGA